MTSKSGPLYALNAGVIITSDKETEKRSYREQKINLVLAPLRVCRQNLSLITGQEKR
jgi:hypothetical protein